MFHQLRYLYDVNGGPAIIRESGGEAPAILLAPKEIAHLEPFLQYYLDTFGLLLERTDTHYDGTPIKVQVGPQTNGQWWMTLELPPGGPRMVQADTAIAQKGWLAGGAQKVTLTDIPAEARLIAKWERMSRNRRGINLIFITSYTKPEQIHDLDTIIPTANITVHTTPGGPT